MNLLKSVRENIQKKKLVTTDERLLVAVSGGLDSMVLLQLLGELGFHLEVAHVNYGLRGEESNLDESLVKEYCLKSKLVFHCYAPDTIKYAADKNISIQMAARELRYKWFSALLKERNLNKVVTAHHADDQSETILLKLLRGSGLTGLSGIRMKTKELIRPLLPFTKAQLRSWAEEHQIPFRNDSSNEKNDYQRNQLRHKVIPLLKEINPALDQTLSTFATFMEAHNAYLKYSIAGLNCAFQNPVTGIFHISTDKLKSIPGLEIILYELLQPFDVHPHDISNMAAVLNEPGKQFFTTKYSITIGRDEILVAPLSNANDFEVTIASVPFSINTPFGNLHGIIENEHDRNDPLKKHIARLDRDKLHFPLKIRTWKDGDFFYPSGMKGKKKVSDFFIDEKLSLPAKKRIPLIFSGDDLVWICNMRLDDRFIARPASRNTVRITFMAGVNTEDAV